MNKIPTIQDKELEASDIGRMVWYTPNYPQEEDYSQWQQGILTSFEYKRGECHIYIKFRNGISERINPNHLRWAKQIGK